MWLKEPNSDLTKYFSEVTQIQKISEGLMNKHLHNMGRIEEFIGMACGMENELAFHL
jgi:hypothetical protein